MHNFTLALTNKGGADECKYGKILRLLCQTYWLNGRQHIIIIIIFYNNHSNNSVVLMDLQKLG
jgi:hypothetical protein